MSETSAVLSDDPRSGATPAPGFNGYRSTVAATILGIFTMMSVGAYAVLIVTATVRTHTDFAALGGAAAVETVCIFLGAIIGSRVYGRVSFRILFAFGVVVVMAYILLYGFATELWMLYVVEVFLGLVLGICAFNGISAFVAAWFIDRRERVVGVALGVVGFGTAVGSILLTVLTGIFGQPAAVIVVAALGLPALLALIWVRTPDGVTQKALGSDKVIEEVTSPDEARRAGRRSLMSVSFVVMLLAALGLGFVQFLGIFIAPIMQGGGLPDPTLAGALVSVSLAANSICCIVLGFVAQRFGIRTYAIVGYIIAVVAVVAFLLWIPLGSNVVFAFVIAFLIGSGVGLATTYSATLVTDIFGVASFNAVMPIIAGTTFVGYGVAVGALPSLVGADGSWDTVLIIVFVAVVLSAVLTTVGFFASPVRRGKVAV
ncbi:MAG TPA: MFS transporter [Pseudolysinimonas sp.]|nr:MFS transporter [Pseudolysinimonas sp.]